MTAGDLRQGQHEPVVGKKDGRPPGWVVRCRDCGWGHDAHGHTAKEACDSIRATHEPRHFLYAQQVDYTKGWGDDGSKPHPLYQGG